MMNIGIDIDGCINDMSEVLALIIKRDYDVNVDWTDYNFFKDLNMNKDKMDRFWEKNNMELYKLLTVEDNATRVIYRLIDNHRINIITAREYNCAELTEKWLKKYDIKYHDLLFCCGNKVNACKWKNIQYMIEDSPENALALAENGIKVILYDKPYNKEVIHNNIVRVFSWEEIYNFILEEDNF